jgi:hypothetical protein
MNEPLEHLSQDDLLQLLSLPIPGPSGQPDGFLEIAGIAHRETINSRIYAHFLNSEHDGVRTTFLTALLELVEEKSGKRIALQNCRAMLEDATDRNCRIDILIRDPGNRSAIIIENKLYHHLDNDLVHYWDHVPYPEEQKAGILLTLEPHVVPQNAAGKFICITHSEWIGRIRQNGMPTDIPASYYQYITDFAHTIDRLTKSYTMNEQARFYFQHAPTVMAAKQTMDEACGFLQDQLDIICSRLGWQQYGSSWQWRNIWDGENELDTYLTIWFEPILNGELQFSIFLELMRDDKSRMSELDELLKHSEQYNRMLHKTHSAGNYVHYGVRNYTLSMQELERFGEHVHELILRDFAETLLTIIRYYYPQVDISGWAANFEGVNGSGDLQNPIG